MEAIAREEPRVKGTWCSIDETRCLVCHHDLLVEEGHELERVEIVFWKIIETTVDFWRVLIRVLAQHIDGVDDLRDSQKRVLPRGTTQFSNFDIVREV